MKLWKKVTITLILILLAVPVGFVILFKLSAGDMCGNYIHKKYASPNNKYKAVVFQRDCGATTGFSTQISILEATEQLQNEGGNTYIIDGHPKNSAPKLSWPSSNELIIHRPLSGNEYKAQAHHGSIKVTYNAVDS